MIAGVLRDKMLPALARATRRPPRRDTGRVLVVQPDHLGDIILSEPAVRYLRHKRPNTELVAVVGPWSAEISRMAWPVDRVVEVDFPGFARTRADSNRLDPYQRLKREIQRIRELEADDALILRDDAWWAAWLAHGAVGGSVVTSAHPRTSLFATTVAPPAAVVHRTAQSLEVVTAYLNMSPSLPSVNFEWDMSPRLRSDWRSTVAPFPQPELPTGHRPLVVVHPGSGAAVKSWPPRSWRSLLRGLGDVTVILSGTKQERDLCDELGIGMEHVRVMAGETSLPQLTALIERAQLALGTDNGPMHLAGAVGTPTVRIFGPSNPARYGPWPGATGQTVVHAGWCCPRCEDLSPQRAAGCGCMAEIAPSTVLGEIREQLGNDA